MLADASDTMTAGFARLVFAYHIPVLDQVFPQNDAVPIDGGPVDLILSRSERRNGARLARSHRTATLKIWRSYWGAFPMCNRPIAGAGGECFGWLQLMLC